MVQVHCPTKLYINELQISAYKIFKDIDIHFQIPENEKNAINIIAGANGSGKTSLLELIVNIFDNNITQEMKKGEFSFRFSDSCIAQKKISGNNHLISIKNGSDISQMNELKYRYEQSDEYKYGIHTSPRIIYLSNKVSFQYRPVLQTDTGYYSFVTRINPDTVMGIAELYIKEYIISHERQSTKADPKERSEDAVASFNAIFKDSDFVTKLADLDPFHSNRPIFKTINNERITIEALSDGEKQLYGRAVSLILLNPCNSVILIDEPEICLHPKWQYTIMDIYRNIGKNNQFIVATHSPHIIAKAHYRELILLKKSDNRIVAEQFDHPRVSRDINSVLGGIMEAKYLPDEIMNRHREYRELVEKGEKASPRAQELRQQILEYEPEESEFMQRIRFYEELRS